MPYLEKSYDSSVASYLTWKLGVTYFLNHPVQYIQSWHPVHDSETNNNDDVKKIDNEKIKKRGEEYAKVFTNVSIFSFAIILEKGFPYLIF